MSKPLLAILAAFAALWTAPAAALTPSEAARSLDGEWRAPDFVLRIDARRAQGSIERDRPFEWDRFLVKEVSGDEIVFTIGAELFEARIEDGLLRLESTVFRGTRVLARESNSVGSGPDLRGSTFD